MKTKSILIFCSVITLITKAKHVDAGDWGMSPQVQTSMTLAPILDNEIYAGLSRHVDNIIDLLGVTNRDDLLRLNDESLNMLAMTQDEKHAFNDWKRRNAAPAIPAPAPAPAVAPAPAPAPLPAPAPAPAPQASRQFPTEIGRLTNLNSFMGGNQLSGSIPSAPPPRELVLTIPLSALPPGVGQEQMLQQLQQIVQQQILHPQQPALASSRVHQTGIEQQLLQMIRQQTVRPQRSVQQQQQYEQQQRRDSDTIKNARHPNHPDTMIYNSLSDNQILQIHDLLRSSDPQRRREGKALLNQVKEDQINRMNLLSEPNENDAKSYHASRHTLSRHRRRSQRPSSYASRYSLRSSNRSK